MQNVPNHVSAPPRIAIKTPLRKRGPEDALNSSKGMLLKELLPGSFVNMLFV